MFYDSDDDYYSTNDNPNLYDDDYPESSSESVISSDSEDDDHFRGAFDFTKRVLSWSINDLRRKTYSAAEENLTALPKKYLQDSYHSSEDHRREYYKSFRPLALAETWATLKQGLEKSKHSKLKFSFQLSKKANIAKNKENPSVMTANNIKLAQYGAGASRVALLLTSPKFKTELIGIATEKFGDNEGAITIKFICNNKHDAQAFKARSHWNAVVLGGLITQERIYHVCSTRPKLEFMDDLVYSKISSWPTSAPGVATPKLNEVQSRVIHSFLSAKEGVYLLQGPPGTGKTTTIVELLHQLIDKEDRVLVCAPSNKAVQVLAKRFYQENKKAHVVLVGVKEKLPPALEEIYLENIEKKIVSGLAILEAWKATLNRLQLNLAGRENNSVPQLEIYYNNHQNFYAGFPIQLFASVFPEFTDELNSIISIVQALSSLPLILKNMEPCVTEIEQLYRTVASLPENYDRLKKFMDEVKRHLGKNQLLGIRLFHKNFDKIISAFNNPPQPRLLERPIKPPPTDHSKDFFSSLLQTIRNSFGDTPSLDIEDLPEGPIEGREQQDPNALLKNNQELINKIKSLFDKIKIYLDRMQEPLDNLSHNTNNLLFIPKVLTKIANHCADNNLKELILDSAEIIFSTLSVTGRQIMREGATVDTVIIDEAGQAVEAETLIPMSLMPKRCLLVGDPKQLPATVISEEAVKFNYGRSMLSRLMEDCKQPYEMLNFQYRMHETIRVWPSNKYYGGRLKDGIKVQPIPQFKNSNVLGTYTFVNVAGQEKPYNQSYCNPEETKLIKSVVQAFTTQGITSQYSLGVITFYSGQVNALQNSLQAQRKVSINTVDGFQGSEKDIIIISCVRSNTKNTVGFLKDFRRLNVAITRAKKMLMIMGNADTLKKSNSKDLRSLVQDAEKRGRLFEEKALKAELKQWVSGTQSKAVELEAPLANKKTKKKRAKKAKSKSENNKKNPCSFFQNTGSCKNGAQCKLAHIEDSIEEIGPKR